MRADQPSPEPVTDTPVTQLQVSGEYDQQNAGDLWDQFAPLLDKGADIEVDMSQVTFFGSSGLTVLIDCRIAAQDAGLQFTVVNPSPIMYRLLEVTSLTELLGPAAGD